MVRHAVGAALVILALATGAACGDDEGRGGTDGGPSDGGPGSVQDPAPPALPTLGPCADGWRELTTPGDPPICEPWPEGGRGDCPDGEAHFPGEPGCATVGSACPAGDLPEDLPSDRPVVYALASAPAGGDGTMGAPHGRIRDAVRDAGADGVAAVGRGVYDEVVEASPGVTIWGACVTGTTVTSTVPNDNLGVVTASGLDAEIRNLRITSDVRAGITLLEPGIALTAVNVIVDRATYRGATVQAGALLRGEGLVVTGTLPSPTGSFGWGIEVRAEGNLELRGAVVDDNTALGVATTAPGGRILLEDTAIIATRPAASDRSSGRGLAVTTGCTAEVRRSVFEQNPLLGIRVAGEGAALTLEDSVSRDGLGEESTGDWGFGLNVRQGGTADVSRALIERNRTMGVYLGDPGTVVTLTDAVIRDQLPERTTNDFGRGVEAAGGSTLQLSRVAFLRNIDTGVFVGTTDTELRGSDVIVQDTAPNARFGDFGRGINIQDDTEAHLERLLVARNRTIAVYVGANEGEPAPSVTIADLVVRDTAARESDRTGGRAVNVEVGATLQLDRARLENSRGIALVAGGGGASITANDIVIDGVIERACVETGCPAFGEGAGAFNGGAATLTDFAIRNVALCGVHVAVGGSLDLHDGEVTHAPIGACIQEDGYDIDRLTDGVVYRDNGTNLDTVNLPIPDALGAGGLP